MYILLGIRDVPYHGDESAHIFMTRDYAYQFIDHDLTRIGYAETPIDTLAMTEQEFRLLNGTVHKYWSGLLWHGRGFTVDDLNRVWWTWGADWAYNLQNGAIPQADLLLTARFASAVLMCLGVIAMFGIGLTVDGRITAYAASAFYALNPALLLNGRRSMLEGSLMLFSLLAVLAALHFARAVHRDKRRTAVGWAGLLGLATGMCVASKHTGLFTVLPLFVGAGLFVWWRWGEQRLKRSATLSTDTLRDAFILTGALFAAGILSLIVFLLLNPAWWGDPLATIRPVLDMRNRLLAEQTAAFGTYPNLFEQVVGYGRQVFVGLPQYYEAPDWAAYIAEQISTYEATPWIGVFFGTTIAGAAAAVGLVLLGFWRLLRGTLEPGTRWLALTWVCGSTALTVLLTPLEWQRYYLPAVLPIAFMMGLGVGALASLAASVISRLSAARAARSTTDSAPSAY